MYFSSSLEDIRKIAGGGDRFTAFCQVAGISDDLRPELGDIAPAFFRTKDGYGGGSQIEAVEQQRRGYAQQMAHHHTGHAQMAEDHDGAFGPVRRAFCHVRGGGSGIRIRCPAAVVFVQIMIAVSFVTIRGKDNVDAITNLCKTGKQLGV